MSKLVLSSAAHPLPFTDLATATAAAGDHHRRTGVVAAIEAVPATLVRRRRGGTEEHRCTTAAEVATACRHILDHGFAKVNGEAMDAVTAGMLVAVWDAIGRQTAHPDYAAKVEARFARTFGDGTGQRPRAALRWLVSFGWKLVR